MTWFTDVTFGFSYVGAVILAMLFVPNIIWSFHRPQGYDDAAKTEKRIFVILEKAGQVLTTVSAVILGTGHIGIHAGHFAQLKNTSDNIQ